MLESCLLVITVGSAAKITTIVFGSVIAIYLLMALGTNFYGLAFFVYIVGFARILISLIIAFGLIFLVILGIGALF